MRRTKDANPNVNVNRTGPELNAQSVKSQIAKHRTQSVKRKARDEGRGTMSVSDPSSGIPSASASGAGALTHERDPKSRTITSSHKAPKAGRSLKLSTILRLSLVLALGLALGVLDLGGLGGVPVKCVRAQYFCESEFLPCLFF